MTGRITQNHKFTITWYEPQTRPPKPSVPLSTHTHPALWRGLSAASSLSLYQTCNAEMNSKKPPKTNWIALITVNVSLRFLTAGKCRKKH